MDSTETMVVVAVVPDSVPPVTLLSVNPVGTFSVMFTVPTGLAHP